MDRFIHTHTHTHTHIYIYILWNKNGSFVFVSGVGSFFCY